MSLRFSKALPSELLDLAAIRQERARRSLLAFTQYTKPDYEVNWHHRVLCHYVDRWLAGDIRRLMVFMPPRTGKSELVSRRLPAYILGRTPDAQIIACSYAADLASRMNRDVQRIMDAPEYGALFPDTRLYGKNIRTLAEGGVYLRNSDLFEVVGHRGAYRSAGVGGGITGMGFDYGIIDDPIKNAEEADSATYRAGLWEWYTSTFYTRQEKDARILLTLTRWHEDDLAGRLLALQDLDPAADRWTVVSFPAILDSAPAPDDPRHDGEALWPSKFGPETLAAIRANDARQWEALYQQRPRPAEGALFKRPWFKVVERAPDGLRWARYWDLAASTREQADYTASAAVALADDGTLYIRDMLRGRWEWPDAYHVIANTMQNERGVSHGIEKALHGLAAVQQLQRDPRLASISFRAVDVDRDKYSRALAWASRAEAGKVALVSGSWVNVFLDEVCAFPLGAHDDQVDTISGGVQMLSSGVVSTMRNPWT